MSLGQYFTINSTLQLQVYNFIKNDPTEILEPSVGIGHLLLLPLLHMPEVKITAFEIDKRLKLLDELHKYNDRITVTNADFLLYDITKKYKTIIGNPPYVKTKSGNLYLEFIKRCFLLLENKGEMIMIIPNDFLLSTQGTSIRNLLLANGSFTDIYYPNDEKLFKNATIDVIVFRYQKDVYHPTVLYNGVPKILKNNGVCILTDYSSVSDAIENLANANENLANDNEPPNDKVTTDNKAPNDKVATDDKTPNNEPPNDKVTTDNKAPNDKVATDDNAPTNQVEEFTLEMLFDISVGLVTGAEHIFKSALGDFPVRTDETTISNYILIKSYPSNNVVVDNHLLTNKDALLKRKIRKFTDNNWFEWGALRNINKMQLYKDTPCIYVKTLTRSNKVAFKSTAGYFSGNLIMLVPKKNNFDIDLDDFVGYLNSTKFRSSYTQSGRFKIGHRQLSLSVVRLAV